MSYTVQERLKERRLARLNKGNLKLHNGLKKTFTTKLEKNLSNI